MHMPKGTARTGWAKCQDEQDTNMHVSMRTGAVAVSGICAVGGAVARVQGVLLRGTVVPVCLLDLHLQNPQTPLRQRGPTATLCHFSGL